MFIECLDPILFIFNRDIKDNDGSPFIPRLCSNVSLDSHDISFFFFFVLDYLFCLSNFCEVIFIILFNSPPDFIEENKQ